MADEQSTREQLKSLTPEEFLKANTRAQMDSMAEELGVDPSEHSKKSDLYDAMVKAANIPDPALRGESEVDSPVARTWLIADRMFAEAREKGQPDPRRKDVVAAARGIGVAFYTARTQYQAWFQHTDGARLLLVDQKDTEGMPKAVVTALGRDTVTEIEEEAETAATNAEA